MLEESEIISLQPEPVTLSADPRQRGGVREVLVIALPMVLSLSFDTLMTFVDRLFLSRLGSEQMSASLAGGLAGFVLMTFFLGLIGYATALVAQHIGAGQTERASAVLTHALGLSLIAYPVILLIRPLILKLFVWSHVDPVQLVPQTIYFNILAYGSLIGLIRHSFSSFFSGIGETRIIMMASLVGLVTNVVLNYVLIFGHFGFPAMGIRGAAIGTICAGFANLLVLAGRYFSRDIRARFHTVISWKFDALLLKEFLRKGTPSGVEMFLNLMAFQLMILIFHGHGLVNATAATIMFNWDMVSYVPLIGLEIAATSLVGRYVGARDFVSAERTTRSGIKIGWGFSIIVMAAFFCVPEQLVNVFRPDPVDNVFLAAFPLAVSMIRIATIYIMIEAVMVVYAGALRGAGDTFWTMVILCGVHWLLVVLLWVCYNTFQLGPISSWSWLVAGFMLFPLMLWLRWRSGQWKTALGRDTIPAVDAFGQKNAMMET